VVPKALSNDVLRALGRSVCSFVLLTDNRYLGVMPWVSVRCRL